MTIWSPVMNHVKKRPRYVQILFHYLQKNGLILYKLSRLMGKPTICICENKSQISFAVTAKLISTCFRYMDSTIPLLNPKFQTSSQLLCLYNPVCVEPVQKPHCWFSHEAAQLLLHSSVFSLMNYVVVVVEVYLFLCPYSTVKAT